MLKKRLIPKLIFKTNKIKEKYYPMIVTTKQYNKIKYVGDPISQAKIFESQLTDELFLVNMDSLDLDENKFLLEYYVEFSSKIFMPLTIGGGVKSIESFRKLLQSGADKVCINTLAIEKPEIITEATPSPPWVIIADTFGSDISISRSASILALPPVGLTATANITDSI